MSDLGISIGYLIFYTTLAGSFTVIGLLTLKAVFRAWAFFKPSTPKKNEIEQISTKSLEPHRDYWICPYCSTSNELTDRSCTTCGSPKKLLRVL